MIRKLETRISNLEKNTWTLTRMTYQFPGYNTVVLNPDMATKLLIPDGTLPTNTRAVLVSIKCEQWLEKLPTGSQMSMKFQQVGTSDAGTTLYTAPMNDFYYEAFVPWDGRKGNLMAFKTTGASNNKYTLKIVGYITS